MGCLYFSYFKTYLYILYIDALSNIVIENLSQICMYWICWWYVFQLIFIYFLNIQIWLFYYIAFLFPVLVKTIFLKMNKQLE